MLNERRSQTAIGLLLLAIVLLGAFFAVSGEIVQSARPHVGADISNVHGTVQISVECEQAAEVRTGEALAVDLGRMPPDTRIFVSVLSSDSHPAWDIEMHSNGASFFEERRGHSKTPLAPTVEANAIVYAQAFTAEGDALGSVGCQGLDVVSKSDVPRYVPSPDEKETSLPKAEESPFQPRHFPYDQIDTIGRWSLPVLAVLGAVAAFATPPVRRLAWSHKGALGTGALAILGAGIFQVAALPTILIFAGTALLFAVASLLVLGEPRARRWLRME